MGHNTLGWSDIRHQNGAVTELIVAASFVNRGYEVWWPQVVQSRADLVVSNSEGFQSVQVKKATWNTVGPNSYLQARVRSSGKPYKKGDFDLLAVADEDHRVWVFPYDVVAGYSCIHLDKRGPTIGKRKSALDVSPYRIPWKGLHEVLL